MEKWSSTGWIPYPIFPFQPDICNTFMNIFREGWIQYVTGLGVDHPDKCPIPAVNIKFFFTMGIITILLYTIKH